MAVKIAFDEEEARLLLAGNQAALARGLRLVDQEYRLKLSAWLRAHFPGLTAADLAECWQETLVAAHKTITTRGFDVNKSLRPFFCTILRRRAINKLRRAKTSNEVLEQIGYALRDTFLHRPRVGALLFAASSRGPSIRQMAQFPLRFRIRQKP